MPVAFNLTEDDSRKDEQTQVVSLKQLQQQKKGNTNTSFSSLLEEEALKEATELSKQISELHCLAKHFNDQLQVQDTSVNLIVEELETTQEKVEHGNDQLAQASAIKSKGTLIQGTVIGMTSGMGVGSALGIHFGGVGLIPGFVLGAICGSLLGGTSSKLIKAKIERTLGQIIKRNKTLINRLPCDQIVSHGLLVPLMRVAPHQVQTVPGPTRLPRISHPTPKQTVLLRGLEDLYKIRNLTLGGLDDLMSQGDRLNRSVRTVENIQQELETTGVLVTRVTSNSVLYFLKIMLVSPDQNKHIGKLMEQINNSTHDKTRERHRHGFAPKPIGFKTPLPLWHLPLVNWQDIESDRGFLLLQRRYFDQYRVVAIDPDNCMTVLKLYYFQASTVEHAKSQFQKIILLITKMYRDLPANQVYKILNHLPKLDSIIEQLPDEELLLDEMKDVLKYQINPTTHAIGDELVKQTKVIEKITDPCIKNKKKIQKYNTILIGGLHH